MTLSDMCSGDALLVPGALRGFRTWTWEPHRGPVRSQGYRWNDGRLTAECGRGLPHAAPDVGCTCGIYGWYRPDDSRLVPGVVFGAVEASGRVLLGDFGFRAEQVRIAGLVTRWPPLMDWCAGAGIATFPTRRALLAELPPEDVEGVLGRRIPAGPEPGTWAHAGQQVDDVAAAVSTYVMRDVQQLVHQVTFAWEQVAPHVESAIGNLIGNVASAVAEARFAADRQQPDDREPTRPDAT